jgi:DNA replication protein DnaC
LDNVAVNALRNAGLANREVRAEWSKVHPKLKAAIPRRSLLDMNNGAIPAKGFGLGSATGTGKTMALASAVYGLMRERRRLYAEWLANQDIMTPPHMTLLWLNWPDTVATIRANALSGMVEDLLTSAESIPLLVLDDLGRERIKGTYIEDWAASQLDRIVNHRYRAELPILWTSNLREEELVAIYGAAMVGRLNEDNPMVWVDGLPSMRIKV